MPDAATIPAQQRPFLSSGLATYPWSPADELASLGISLSCMAIGTLIGMRKGHPVIGWILGNAVGALLSTAYSLSTMLAVAPAAPQTAQHTPAPPASTPNGTAKLPWRVILERVDPAPPASTPNGTAVGWDGTRFLPLTTTNGAAVTR